ncbi:hypothetical protein GGS20DRAFT_555230 [Poronia punctata]|nr:hypothetical protein GGS20DRAFT_555230 [Poronia punctata]
MRSTRSLWSSIKHRPVRTTTYYPRLTSPTITTAAAFHSSSTKMDNNTKRPTEEENNNTKALPALPPAGQGDTQTIEVGGAALKLDHLGPLVVNEDGTMSRISNWDKMADIEKENTLRILGKRNQMRLAKLRAAQADPQKAEGESEKS